VVILDLADSLDALGHEVTLYAPEGTRPPPHGRVLPMPCSFGKYPPSSQDCETACFNQHAGELLHEDIVHDFSVTKQIAETLHSRGMTHVISTPLGGQWAHPDPPVNIVVWSHAMRARGLRGASDYEGTQFHQWIGPPQRPIKDAHVVYGGVDTSLYTPDYAKKGFFLWMNRWHPAKGYQVAIELARRTDIELVMAGEHPDRELFTYQRDCALEAVRLATGLPNVRFEWLPADPHHHDAKRELYRQARALLYTVQFQEPFGLSQAEALASGTPVIGIGMGSVPEVVSHGRTGFVCENDVADVIRAVDKIDQISPQDCRREAVERFDRKVMAQNYLAEYEAILNGRGWGA
jgi:glycosyltransferase involved in cell wall biosynthesis